MATWEGLTQEQRDSYQTFEREVRSFMGTFQRLMNTADRLKVTYDAQIADILTALDDNTVVPNSSGLGGSVALNSDTEFLPMLGWINTLLTSYNTAQFRQWRDKAAGTVNTGGEV